MPQPIHIPEPCPASWDAMKPCSNGRFCGSCQKVVVDFSNKSLDEIHEYLDARKDEHICGQYHERHVEGNTSRWYNILNRVEAAFNNLRLQRLAVIMIGMILFITGCRTNKHCTRGRFAYRDRKAPTEVNQTNM